MITLPFPYQHEVIFNALPHSEMGWRRRPLHAIRGVNIHRCSVADSVDGIARWYMQHKGWAGIPYHFTIDPRDGDPIVYQTSPLTAWTAGIAGYNYKGVHVAVIGDWRTEAPSDLVLCAAACLSADLLGFGVGRDIKGHSERSLSLVKKWWTTKQCPGRMFDLDRVRKTAENILQGNESGLPVLPVSEPWWKA